MRFPNSCPSVELSNPMRFPFLGISSRRCDDAQLFLILLGAGFFSVFRICSLLLLVVLFLVIVWRL